MKHDVEHLRRALMRAARACPPSAAVPEGFERRVLARLRQGAHEPEPVLAWVHGLVRAAWASAAVALVLCAWLWGSNPVTSGTGPAPDLETTLLAVMEDSSSLGW